MGRQLQVVKNYQLSSQECRNSQPNIRLLQSAVRKRLLTSYLEMIRSLQRYLSWHPIPHITHTVQFSVLSYDRIRQKLIESHHSGPTTIRVMSTAVPAGVELVEWLHRNVKGFKDRQEVEFYANYLVGQAYVIPARNPLNWQQNDRFDVTATYIVQTRPIRAGKLYSTRRLGIFYLGHASPYLTLPHLTSPYLTLPT